MLCLIAQSLHQKLTEELKSFVGRCEIPHTSEKSMRHALPYFEASIDTCRDCTLNQAFWTEVLAPAHGL